MLEWTLLEQSVALYVRFCKIPNTSFSDVYALLAEVGFGAMVYIGLLVSSHLIQLTIRYQ